MSRTGRKTSIELHRVVITGMGAISPAGIGADLLWQKVKAGNPCFSLLSDDQRERFGVHVAGIIPDYDPLEVGFTRKEARRLSPFVQYALLAADEAMAQAHFDAEKEDTSRFACVFGSGIGGIRIIENESVVLHTKGAKRVSPLFIPTMISNMAAGNLAIRFGLRGDCLNVVTACATASHCIGEAYRLIRFGLADAALAGGSEESTSPLSLAGFANLGAISRSADVDAAALPFDRRRSGFVPGEGGAALVLESLEHAESRGAAVLAEITGFGSTGDAYHITAPEPCGDGALRAMRQALDEAGLLPEEIGHLNAHGTATPANDKAEACAWRALLQSCAEDIPVTSVKGCVGHMLGAAGAIEAIVSVKSLLENIIPPTAGFRDPDPECAVSVPKHALAKEQKAVLSNSLGFGGHNAALVISSFEER